MWRGNGEWICRPLNNPQKIAVQCLHRQQPERVSFIATRFVTSPIIRTLWADITNAKSVGGTA
ncbi:hypothetical protein ACNKHV_10985 [Shigella flexneri]